MNNNIEIKKLILFELRNVIDYFTYEDIQELLSNLEYFKKENDKIHIFCKNMTILINNNIKQMQNYDVVVAYFNNKHFLHRIDKPAVIFVDKICKYYLHGNLIKQK